MSAEGRQPGDEAATRLYPSVWLIVPTLFLLLGQAAAAAPSPIPPQAGSLVLVPLALVVGVRWRRWAILVLLAMLTFAVGYVRHRHLLFPEFPENHLHRVMTRGDRLYLEGTLRQEPERLINRSRW